MRSSATPAPSSASGASRTAACTIYSARHWSGSLTDLHLARWRAWANWLASAADGEAAPSDPEPLRAEIRRIEEDWRDSTSPYPTAPRGDLAAAALALLDLAEPQLPRIVPATT